ncbi:MAG: hypothetical protein MHM6MM_007918 [Cercozoa sp. M6MM]
MSSNGTLHMSNSCVHTGQMSAMSLALPMRPFPLHVAVTVLLEDPSDLPEQADVSKVLRAVDSVVKLAEQSGLGRIRADAQLRFFGSLSSRAARRTRYAETDEFVLDTEDLSEFVGRTQWNLESMTHSARALNLLVYLPKREQRPLRFLDDNTNDNNNNNSKNKNNHNNNNKEGEGRSDTILVPRWGAIVSADDVSFLTEEQHQVHQRVRRLMRTLLGVPSTQQLSQVVPAASVDLRGLRWPLAVHHWHREWHQDALQALNRLLRLLQQESHVPVPETVAQSIQHCMQYLRVSAQYPYQVSLREAIEAAREARRLALSLQTEASLLPAAHFPTHFSYAVMAPFFLPAFAPVLLALLGELKRVLRARKEPADRVG